jgi:F-type H+-transporting ATPase subunit a
MLNRVWVMLSIDGANPMLVILAGIGAGSYALLASLGNVLSASVFYVVAEADEILVAGVSSLIGLLALIALPLITPLAWTFLLAITFLEMVIAFLQAYVFITLSSMYLNDVIKLH